MSKIDHGRGTIQHNALGALVTSKVFRPKSVPPKKGKGAVHSRKMKHKSRDLRL